MILPLAGCIKTVEPIETRIDRVLPVAVREKPERAAGTIWPGERRENLLFVDSKAKFEGDIITVLVDESASGKNSANTKTVKNTSHTAGIAGMTQALPDKRILAKYELGGSSTSQLAGSGDTSRDGRLQAVVTACVTEVFANGNLFIQGKRLLTVNEEEQYIIISGIVRPDDVSDDNVVLSQHMADARIIYAGKGVIHDKMHPGWMTRILDWVWPF
jgi:flagellar L-ring protein precursor FlgH